MISNRFFCVILFLFSLSLIGMDVDRNLGYTDDERDDDKWISGPAFCWAACPDFISILNFDSEREVYFYQKLFELVDRGSINKRMRCVIQNKDQARINIGPLKYFVLRLLVGDEEVQYSIRNGGYIPRKNKKVLADLGPIKFNHKRGVEYHVTDASNFAELIQKQKKETKEESQEAADFHAVGLNSVGILTFDSMMRRYCYEPLLEHDTSDASVLIFSKYSPEVIDLGPAHYFGIWKHFYGWTKRPVSNEYVSHVISPEYKAERSDGVDELLGEVEKVMVKNTNDDEVGKLYHVKVFPQ